MIISMNATVCGDMNHGEERRHKIVGSNEPKGMQADRKSGGDLGRQEIVRLARKRCSVG
jgi:hypothetical protein